VNDDSEAERHMPYLVLVLGLHRDFFTATTRAKCVSSLTTTRSVLRPQETRLDHLTQCTLAGWSDPPSFTLVQAEAPVRHYITTTAGAVTDVNIQAAEWKSVKSEGVDDQGTSRPHRRDLPAQAMGWDVIRARLNRLDLLLEISVTNKTTFV
jgi:hypothetical protein